MVTQQPDFFKEIKKGHAPKILWIGCSDARVPANEIIGEPPGSVFIHRNIANMVVNTDFNCMSVIQFAVSVLKVKHIIICGHYDCGGIKASLETNDYNSPLCNWLRNIRDTYRYLHLHLLSLSFVAILIFNTILMTKYFSFSILTHPMLLSSLILLIVEVLPFSSQYASRGVTLSFLSFHVLFHNFPLHFTLPLFLLTRLHREELNALGDLRARQRRLVELNVIEQVFLLFTIFKF